MSSASSRSSAIIALLFFGALVSLMVHTLSHPSSDVVRRHRSRGNALVGEKEASTAAGRESNYSEEMTAPDLDEPEVEWLLPGFKEVTKDHEEENKTIIMAQLEDLTATLPESGGQMQVQQHGEVSRAFAWHDATTRSRALQYSTNEFENEAIDHFIGKGFELLEDAATKAVKKLTVKIATKFVSVVAAKALGALAGPVFGIVVSGVTFALGLIGQYVNRDKCKLRCCPSNGLSGDYACKYQNSKQTCINGYSDYKGHGDHACYWDENEQRCEVGTICRANGFDFFALFGGGCDACDALVSNEPQWSVAAMKNYGISDGAAEKFFTVEVGHESDNAEFTWCAPHGVTSCFQLLNQYDCESSYADMKGDRNCQWSPDPNDPATSNSPNAILANGSCRAGKKCQTHRDVKHAENELGLKYEYYAWRHKSSNKPVDDYTCRWARTNCLETGKCPEGGGVDRCSDVKSQATCERSYRDHWGDKYCQWQSGKCSMYTTQNNEGVPCHNKRPQHNDCDQDISVCKISSAEPYTPEMKIVIEEKMKKVEIYGPYKGPDGTYPLLRTSILAADGTHTSGGTDLTKYRNYRLKDRRGSQEYGLVAGSGNFLAHHVKLEGHSGRNQWAFVPVPNESGKYYIFDLGRKLGLVSEPGESRYVQHQNPVGADYGKWSVDAVPGKEGFFYFTKNGYCICAGWNDDDTNLYGDTPTGGASAANANCQWALSDAKNTGVPAPAFLETKVAPETKLVPESYVYPDASYAPGTHDVAYYNDHAGTALTDNIVDVVQPGMIAAWPGSEEELIGVVDFHLPSGVSVSRIKIHTKVLMGAVLEAPTKVGLMVGDLRGPMIAWGQNPNWETDGHHTFDIDLSSDPQVSGTFRLYVYSNNVGRAYRKAGISEVEFFG